MGSDDMRVLHPGWDSRDRPSDRPRRPRLRLLLVLVVALVVMTTCSLLRSVPEPPPNRPAFPPEAFTPPPPRTPAPSVPTPSAWTEGGPQVHPRTLPAGPARIATPADDLRECGIDDLSVVNHGWDAATGNTWTSLTATNMTSHACLLAAWPQVRLGQPYPLSLTFREVSTDASGQPAPTPRLVLEPRQGATLTLWWRGFRDAADQKTPQRLIVRFGSGDWREVPLEGPGPAPFDVKDGAELEIGPWTPSSLAKVTNDGA